MADLTSPPTAPTPTGPGEQDELLPRSVVWRQRLRPVARRLLEVVTLLLGISTLLFFLLHLTGDPAVVLAGEFATPETVERISARYGFDDPLIVQYVRFVGSIFVLDFGASVATGAPALGLVMERLGPTMLLAVLGLALNMAISVPLGAWLGSRPDAAPQQVGNAAVFISQGIPGYVVGLVLIQIFSVRLGLLPSVGMSTVWHWILPSVTLASFLAPKLVRVLSANVAETMREDYVRTARASGAPRLVLLWRHALPNALLGATALAGTQLAFMLSGSLITEVIFAWPGLGRLLIDSVVRLDFPIVQAAVFVIAVLVFAANALTDVLFQFIDPRLRRQQA